MSQETPAVPGAANQASTCDSRRWRGVDRAGVVGHRDEEILKLLAQGHSHCGVAVKLGFAVAVVARVRRAGGAS